MWESALGSAIEVAIALAGFSGIVAAVGRRGAGHWDTADQLRLQILLTASGVALVFAFLPFLLLESLGSPLAWRVGSALQAVWVAAITAYRTRQFTSLETEVLAPWRLGIQVAVFVLLAANAVWVGSPAVYVLGVLWSLTVAFLTFVRLLLDSWDDPSESRPPTA